MPKEHDPQLAGGESCSLLQARGGQPLTLGVVQPVSYHQLTTASMGWAGIG
jgi:hypothetical protein